MSSQYHFGNHGFGGHQSLNVQTTKPWFSWVTFRILYGKFHRDILRISIFLPALLSQFSSTSSSNRFLGGIIFRLRYKRDRLGWILGCFLCHGMFITVVPITHFSSVNIRLFRNGALIQFFAVCATLLTHEDGRRASYRSPKPLLIVHMTNPKQWSARINRCVWIISDNYVTTETTHLSIV
jgi:hypothetical protein